MIRRIVMALAFAAVAVAVPTVAASPASAAPCQDSDPWRGPYWWAGVDATNDASERMVLASTPPWSRGSTAYMWEYNNDNRQKWWMDCTSPGIYKMRLASDTLACLTENGRGLPARLWPCDWSDEGMFWLQQAAGSTYTTHDGIVPRSYRFVSSCSGDCLDVHGGGSANGTMVTTWACTSGDNQRWY